MAAGILTLTTDFGANGPYVAAMKGVVLTLAYGTQIVDVSHSIAPQDIAEASFVLASIVEYFPVGTVHLAVVDPGVGTNRRLVVVDFQGRWFVLPDNGLISGVLQGRDHSGIWQIRNEQWERGASATFHGRDILAPAAAHLLVGKHPRHLGPAVSDLVLLPNRLSLEENETLVGEVVFVDSFGNLITTITRDRLGPCPLAEWSVEILGRTVDGMIRTYGDCSPGQLVALIGSSDRVEVAIVNGNAARSLQAARGTPIRLYRNRGPIE